MPSRKKPNSFILVDGQYLAAAQALMVRQSVGAGQLDVCEFELQSDDILTVTSLGAAVGSEIEVIMQAAANNAFAGPTVLHWGRLAVASITTDGKIRYTSRMEPFHFGEPLRGMLEQNPLAQAQPAKAKPANKKTGNAQPPDPPPGFLINDAPLVFNPRIDDRSQANCLTLSDAGFPVFVDPESVRTDAAKKLYAGQLKGQADGTAGPDRWNLAFAVLYLGNVLNSAQTNIANPTNEDLQAFPEFFDDSLLDNFHLPNGLFLSQALDYLLTPFGYLWHVQYLGKGNRKIVIKKRGVGQQRFLRLQLPGSSLDTTLSNTEQFAIDYNIGSAINRVDALADFPYIEAEFDLVQAWDKSLDNLDEAALTRGQPTYEDNPDYQRVYRDFVLNEAGDYCGLRDSIKKPFDLSAIFGHPVVPRRRKFHPTLTQASDLSPIGELTGVHVRIKTPGTGGVYVPLENFKFGACHLLQRECGIRFAGEQPPDEFLMAGADNIAIKITATIRDDRRLATSYSNLADSVLGVVHPLQLDAGHRYAYRQIDKSSYYYDDVHGGVAKVVTRKAAEQDDTSALKTFAQQVRDSWDLADVSGSVTIEGFDHETYEMGDVITGIRGRQIGFGCRPDGSADQRYPQIVAITWDFQKQKRMLTLQTMRSEHVTRALR